MWLGPGEHEAQLSAPERAFDDLKSFDLDLRAAVGMTGVEVRRVVIVEYIAITIPKKRLMVGMSAHDPARLGREPWACSALGDPYGPLASVPR